MDSMSIAGSWGLERQGDGVYCVRTSEGVRGYLERVGEVWVTLEGPRFDRCVEIGQSLSIDRAASLLLAA